MVPAMRSSFFGIPALLLCACVGCGGGPNITGTWVDNSHNITLHFNADGTYSQDSHKGHSKVTVLGTYTLSCNHLTMKTKDAQFEHVPPAVQAGYKNQLVKQPPDECEVEVVGQNQLSMIHGPVSESFDRG
jgi:hypothetical protein